MSQLSHAVQMHISNLQYFRSTAFCFTLSKVFEPDISESLASSQPRHDSDDVIEMSELRVNTETNYTAGSLQSIECAKEVRRISLHMDIG